MYQVEFTTGAEKDLSKIATVFKKKILLEIEELAQNPYQKSQVKKLVNSAYCRLRVGDYRVVYELLNKKLVILVIHIKKWDQVYK